MKKVLFMIPSLGHGGAEKVLVNLVNHMDQNRFEITVMTLFDGGINRRFLAPHICYQAVFKRVFPGNCRILSLFPPRMLHKLFVREKYDIEVSYLEGPTARIIAGGKRADSDKSCKYVSWIHAEQHTAKVASYAFRNYEEARKLYGAFDQLVSVSKTVSDDFQSIFHLDKAPMVLYNAVESDVIVEKSTEPVDPVLFSKKEINLISVGTLKAVKGFDRLLRIHKRLRDKNLPVHTYILGKGPDIDNLNALAVELGITASVTFLGYHINPYKYVAKCDLFVCSSYSEGFSTAATEALIVGTPVCTTLVSGMKEMLGENNDYGIITENSEDGLFDGIYKMLSTPGMLDHYKEKAMLRGQTFSTEKTVKAVEDMLCS